LFRHSGKAINFIDVLVEKGIQVYISGIPKDFSRQEDKFLYSMEAVVAAYERDSILRRTAMGHKKMQDLGRSYSGHIFGYKKELTKQGKVILVPDEVEAPIVRKLFELRAERTPYTKLLKWMNSTGVPTKRGAKAWQSVVVTHMLRNIAYIGKTRNSDGAVIPSVWYPPIVDEEVFGQVQALRDSEAMTWKSYKTEASHMLAGILRCAHCGAGYYWKTTLYKGQPKYFTYYHSRHKPSPHNGIDSWKACRSGPPTFRSELLDDLCPSAFLYAFSFTKSQEKIFTSLQNKINLEKAEFQELSRRVNAKMKENEDRRATIRNAIIVDKIPASFFVQDIQNLEKESVELEKQLLGLKNKILESQSSYEAVRTQFSFDTIDRFAENQRDVLRETVMFRVHSADCIDMVLKATGEPIVRLNPNAQGFVFDLDAQLQSFSKEPSEWGTSIDLVHVGIYAFWDLLKQGVKTKEAVWRAGLTAR
jgi:hypothetical protein